MRRLAGLLLTVVVAGCGDGGEQSADGTGLVRADPPTGHVHAIGVDPADGSVVLAAHTGLFRAARGATRATRWGTERRDVMGFTVAGPRAYVGSGHPDPRSGEPPSVGFIRSADAGRTWTTVSLGGEADLHVLEVAGPRVYAYDALSARFLASTDTGRTWRRTVLPPVLDVAVDPTDPETVVASAEDGLLRSLDGGRTWRPVDDTPPSHLVWTAGGLLRLGTDGTVRQAKELGQRAAEVGELPVPPAAATASGDVLLVAADDGSVVRSADGGRTWARHLAPSA